MGSLVKMKITAFKDEKFSSKVTDYTLMLNPESLKWDRSIEYNDQQPMDNSAGSSKYKQTSGEKLSFDTVIDCTGVVDSSRTNLPSEVDKLKKVIYEYNGEIHRPNFVGIFWGSDLTFQGILTNFDISYTLFKPDGTPLRAKISLRFTSYVAPSVAAKKAAPSSPDLTHMVDVVAGDSLPQLSQKYLDSNKYFVQLAEFNGLNKFRQLQAGSRLFLPPVVHEGEAR